MKCCCKIPTCTNEVRVDIQKSSIECFSGLSSVLVYLDTDTCIWLINQLSHILVHKVNKEE